MDAVPYLHAEPEDPVPLLIGERVGLVVPSTVTGDGICVSAVDTAPQAIAFRLSLQLSPVEFLYNLTEVSFSAVSIDDLKAHMPELPAAGVAETIDIEAETVNRVRWHALRRAVAEDVHMPVLVDNRETHLLDEELTNDELTALCWLRARLTFDDVNTLIAEQFGCTPVAAATRLKRARQAGVVPPVERQGQRKAR